MGYFLIITSSLLIIRKLFDGISTEADCKTFPVSTLMKRAAKRKRFPRSATAPAIRNWTFNKFPTSISSLVRPVWLSPISSIISSNFSLSTTEIFGTLIRFWFIRIAAASPKSRASVLPSVVSNDNTATPIFSSGTLVKRSSTSCWI